ncbi:MAG: TerB family tellurite resistance protein [Pseudomonadota bacterium]
MRLCATDSPDAVCRLLALSMIVDGHMAPSEIKALEHSAILERLGVDADTFDDAVMTLCEDLLETARRHDRADIEIDNAMLDRLLDEVADPLLRMHVLKAMLDIVHADRLIDSREHLLLQRAQRKWSTPADIGAVTEG